MKNTKREFQDKHLGKLTSNRIKWHGHIWRIIEEKIPKKILKMKVKKENT
jgi:hypothetical protein